MLTVPLLPLLLLLYSELVEYKYVVMNADGTVERWQQADNLKMEVPVAQVRAQQHCRCVGWGAACCLSCTGANGRFCAKEGTPVVWSGRMVC